MPPLETIQGTKLFLILILETSAKLARERGNREAEKVFLAASRKFKEITPEQVAAFLESPLYRKIKNLDSPGTNLLS